MYDSIKQKGKRKRLVEKLVSKGIRDKRVLEAILNIPRHFFMDKDFHDYAYDDKAFPISNNQTISQPYTVAFQTELLDVCPYHKILEIGTGSGYQAALLYLLNTDVYTIERQKELFDKTKDFLPSLGYNCKFIYGDGYKGLPNFAPFDRILVTCGAPVIPKELISQLKDGGKMVVPVGEGEVQKMHLIQRVSKDENKITTHGDFSFVPMLNNKEF